MKKPEDYIDEYIVLSRGLIIVFLIWLLIMIFALSNMVSSINDDSEAIQQLQERLFLKPEIKIHEIDNILISYSCLLPISSVVYAKQEVNAIITGYSSTPDQTDSTPFITA